MKSVVVPFACIAAFFLVSCTNYRIHLQVLPQDTYNVKLNDEIDKGKTDSTGAADVVLMNMSKAASPQITVTNKKYSGFVVLDAYVPMLAARNLDTLSVAADSAGWRRYNLQFIVDPVQFRAKHAPAPSTPAPVERVEPPAATVTETPFPDQQSSSFEASRKTVHSINDNPQYARKLAVTGATCNFIGMGLNYATAFIPVYNSDGSVNSGGLVTSLLMGVASGPLQIAGTSYAIGGAKLAWELGGENKCDASKQPFDLWTAYKGGWVLTAVGGIFSVISGFVPKTDEGTALTFSLISVGLNIGRDVFWTISNIKALSMTRKVKECCEEQKMPAHRVRLELAVVLRKSFP
jgi:hypothetical protein